MFVFLQTKATNVIWLLFHLNSFLMCFSSSFLLILLCVFEPLIVLTCFESFHLVKPKHSSSFSRSDIQLKFSQQNCELQFVLKFSYGPFHSFFDSLHIPPTFPQSFILLCFLSFSYSWPNLLKPQKCILGNEGIYSCGKNGNILLRSVFKGYFSTNLRRSKYWKGTAWKNNRQKCLPSLPVTTS